MLSTHIKSSAKFSAFSPDANPPDYAFWTHVEAKAGPSRNCLSEWFFCPDETRCKSPDCRCPYTIQIIVAICTVFVMSSEEKESVTPAGLAVFNHIRVSTRYCFLNFVTNFSYAAFSCPGCGTSSILLSTHTVRFGKFQWIRRSNLCD